MAIVEDELGYNDNPGAGALGTPLLPMNTWTPLAYEAQRLIAAAGARLYGISGYSSRTSGQFILLFDAQSFPSNGAQAVFVMTVGAVSNFNQSWGTGRNGGRAFQRGIVICNSSTAPTLTLGSNDCFFDAQWDAC